MWDSIESAPKDKYIIVGHFDPELVEIEIVRWNPNGRDNKGYWENQHGDSYKTWWGTHWQDLPEDASYIN
ncbi:MAG: hypothetical protein AAGA83_00310 [Cyanobacteria bacterium P01_F01_bin.116]